MDLNTIKAYKIIFTTVRAALNISELGTGKSKKGSNNYEIKSICNAALKELKKDDPDIDCIKSILNRLESLKNQPTSPVPNFAQGGVMVKKGEFIIPGLSKFQQRIEAMKKQRDNIN